MDNTSFFLNSIHIPLLANTKKHIQLVSNAEKTADTVRSKYITRGQELTRAP